MPGHPDGSEDNEGLLADGSRPPSPWGTGGPSPEDLFKDALKGPTTSNVPSTTATGTTVPAPPPPPPTYGDSGSGGDTGTA